MKKNMMILLIAVAVFALACGSAFAQPAQPAPAAATNPIALIKEGKTLMTQGDLDGAERKLLDAVALGEQLKSAPALQFGYTLLGKVYTAKGNSDKAIESYEKASVAFAGNARMLSVIFMSLGDLCLDSGRNADAVKYYQNSIDNYKAAGDASMLDYLNNSIAMASTAAGDYDKADAIYSGLLADARTRGNATDTLRILTNIGNLRRTQSDYDKALASYEEALKLAERTGSESDRVLLLNSIALVHEYRGDSDKAEAALKKALDIATAAVDDRSLAATYHQLGILLLYKGDANGAVDDFKKAADAKEKIKDTTLWGTLEETGRAYYFSGNYKLARKYYNDALKAGPPVDASITINNNLAMVYKMQGMPEYALERFKESLEKARQFKLRYQTSYLLNNIGVVLRETGKPDEALKMHQEALEIDKSVGAKQDEIVDMNNIALVYKDKAEYDKALDILVPALPQAKLTSSSDDYLRTLVNTSDVMFLKTDYDGALKNYQEAVDYADKVVAPERQWKALFGIGQTWDKKGDADKAVEYYKKAIGIIENLRANIGGDDDEKSGFLVDKVKVYIKLIQLLFTQGKYDEALDYLERMKARSLLDMIQRGKGNIDKGMAAEEIQKEKDLKAALAMASKAMGKTLADKGADSPDTRAAKDALDKAKKELGDFSEQLYRDHPGLAFARGENKPVTAAEFRKYLEDDEIIVAYLLTDDTSYAWTITKDQVKMYDLKETGEKIGFLIDQKLREALEKGVWQSAQERAANKLYKLVIEPFEADLAGKKVMGVLPDGRLYEIPFYLMMDANKSFLIDKLAVFYIPSLSLMVENRKSKSALKPETKVLAFGNPTFTRQDLVQLPGTETEVAKITEVFGQNASVYIHDAALEERIKLYGRGFRVLHMATHGLLNNNNPMFSSIAMSQVKDQKDDGYLEAREINNIDLDAELVVMSACDSGRGRLKPGEGILGLTRAFFSAGVPGIIASLWQVNDQATSFMMREFYSKIQSERPVDAMREAQLATKKEFGDNPNLWAPFIIMGYGVDGTVIKVTGK